MNDTPVGRLAALIFGSKAQLTISQKLKHAQCDVSLAMNNQRPLKDLRQEIADLLGVDVRVAWPKTKEDWKRYKAVMRKLIREEGTA